MNKYDKRFVVILVVIVLCFYLPMLIHNIIQPSSQREVVVYYKDQEILRQKLSVDNKYVVDGTLGDVEIEVKDGKVRVEKENSPYNICSIQGWVDSSAIPIVCLPNDIVVRIIDEGNLTDNELDTVIQ